MRVSAPLLLGGGIIAGAGLKAKRWRRAHSDPGAAGKKVLILGAGFAGLTIARILRADGPPGLRVLLVDKNNYHLFTPLLYQVATCSVDPYDVAFPIRQFAGRNGIDFRRSQVTALDLQAKKVQLIDGEEDYDYLVLSLGTTTNFFHNSSAEQNALPLKWLEEAMAIRNHVLDQLEKAVKISDPEERRRCLTFVIIGGGATGVETAGSLANLVRDVLPRDYPSLATVPSRIVVVESESKLLGHMGDEVARLTLAELRDQGVDVLLNVRAEEVGREFVRTSDGQTINAGTIIWSAGIRVPEVISGLQIEHGKGGSIAVDDFLRARGAEAVFAAGDNAHAIDRATGESVPLLAATAVRQGEAVARNIIASLESRPLVPYMYRDTGSYVSLGKNRGAASFRGHTVGGLPAWLAWRAIHLALITSARNRLATALDWTTGYFYDRDTSRLAIAPVDAQAVSDDRPGSEAKVTRL